MEEKLKSIIALAVEMRKAQKDYSKTRDYVALRQSKILEKRFDEEVQKLLESSADKEPNLFTTNPGNAMETAIQ